MTWVHLEPFSISPLCRWGPPRAGGLTEETTRPTGPGGLVAQPALARGQAREDDWEERAPFLANFLFWKQYQSFSKVAETLQ